MNSGLKTFLLSLLLAASGFSQVRTSAIAGRVTDARGGAVGGAKVQATNTATRVARTAPTDAEGAYRLPSLEVGTYLVTAEREGFKTSRHEGVLLVLDRDALSNHVLEVGSRTETVTVTETAQLVETSASAMTGVVDARTISSLPLNGRDYIQLATLQAGASTARARPKNANYGFGMGLSISGSRPAQNSFRLDGMSMNSYHNSTPGSINGVNLGVDAIEEFSVHTSGSGAQYGRAAGGTVNAVTRSGGNEFHGGAFYFHRNDNFDARNFFDGAKKPEFRRNQFGGMLGGPLRKERTFFFTNFEGLREARGNTTINTTMSAAAREGRLTTGTVPVDAAIAKAVALYPLPNGPTLGDTGLFIFTNDEIGYENFVTSRIDHNFRPADRLFVRHSFDGGTRQSETDFETGIKRNRTRVHSIAIEETHIVSSQVLNAVRVGALRTFTLEGATISNLPGADTPSLAFVPGAGAMGQVLVTGLTDHPGGTGANAFDRLGFESYQFSDDLTLMWRRHTVRMGGNFERIRHNSESQSRNYGDFRFRSVSTFLTNTPDRFRAVLPGSDAVRGYRQALGGAYVQDAWRVTPRLTIDLGVRWEMASVPTEVNGKLSNLDRLTDTATRTTGPLFENPSRLNFAPRTGVAWDVAGNGRMIVRAGYGIFNDLILTNYLTQMGVRNPPAFLRGETRNVVRGDFPSGAYARFVRSNTTEYRVERLERNPSQPYVQQWNTNIEVAAGGGTVLRAGYAGSRGVRLSSIVSDSNLVQPVTAPDGRLFYPANGVRPNSVFTRIRDHRFDASSFYHAFQGQVRRRWSRGVQTQVSYTFSKNIDDSSLVVADTEATNGAWLPCDCGARFNRGLSSYDVRHVLAANGTWELPLAPGPGLRTIFGGWQLSGIVTASSGMPMSVFLSYDAARTKTGETGFGIGQRPDLAPGVSGSLTTGDPNRWIRAAAFRRPEPGYLGNLGRNTLFGPGLANLDFSAMKSIPLRRLREGAVLDFRFEFFNLLNHTNFDIPIADRLVVFNETSVVEDFGRITSAGKGREIQFGLKLRF